MNVTQRVVLSALLVVILIGFISMMVWIQRPHFVVLYSNLTPETAGEIVDRLKEQNVKYNLTKNGTTIEVPSKQVYDLRIQLARDGLPEQGETGYELFDTNKLGMSDFMQKISYRRALEGELMRTIQQMEEIEFARLHIVIPEPSLFEEDKQEPTASIVLKLRPNANLGKQQIKGIAYLVAGSVEGLKAENVTIVDSYGNILSDQTEQDSVVGLTASQLEMKKSVDLYLANKVQSLFDQVLGAGNSVVRVDADLDFKQVNKTVESYDPDNTSVRSEEIISEANPVDTNQTGTMEHTTTNYELNRTVENVLESSGNIRRLSVAILVNGIQKVTKTADGQEQVEIVPRTDDELNQLANIARNAVGFYEQRNDQLTITPFNFDTSQADREMQELKEYERRQMIMSIIHKAVLGLIVLIFLLYVRSILRKVAKRVPAKPEQPELDVEHMVELSKKNAPVEDEDLLREMTLEESQESKIAKQQHEKIKEFAHAQPEEMSKLIRTWIEEDNTIR